MLTAESATDPAAALRARFADAIVLDGDEGWDAARMSFNLVVDQRPEAVARPESAPQAAEIVAAAAELGLRVHAQGSAHNTGVLPSLDGTLLVRLDRLGAVEIDAERRSARVEAGARWWDVVPRASGLGLTALHGSSPEINVVGYTLGGGCGWQARTRGLQANSVTAIEVATADGILRRVDADHEPDLFWALRGGSGNFGVVTAIEFRLYELAELYAGSLFFPFEQGAEVLRAWAEWTRTAPEEATTSARLLQFPPLDDVPEIVRGKSFTVVNGAFLGGEEEAVELLRPLRELGPVMDGVGMVPPAALSDMHMDPVEPIPWLSTHALLGAVSGETIDAAAELAASGPVPIFELRHGGGALSRPPAGAGAISSLPGEYMLFAAVPVMDPAQVPSIEATLAEVDRLFASEVVGGYLNFTEREVDLESLYPAGTVERLREVKARYDPGNVIRGNHELVRA